MTTDDTTTSAFTVACELREMRARAGLSRAHVAALAGCSLSSLGAMEAGAVPKHSVVLTRVLDVLRQHVGPVEYET